MTSMQKERPWFNSFHLKVLALFLMTLDHVEYFLGTPSLLEVPSFFGLLGRIAAPLFLFCMAQGFHYTHSKGSYLLRLYVAAVGMYFANSLVERALPHPDGAMIINAIFGTIFLVGAYCWILETFIAGVKARKAGKILLSIVLFLLPLLLDVLKFSMMMNPKVLQGNGLVVFNLVSGLFPSPMITEGSFYWVILGVGMYFLRDKRKAFCLFYLAFCGFFLVTALQAEVSLVNLFVINQQWFMVFALPFMLLYNGKRGHGMKYLFYVYYPGHIYLLSAIAFWMGRMK